SAAAGAGGGTDASPGPGACARAATDHRAIAVADSTAPGRIRINAACGACRRRGDSPPPRLAPLAAAGFGLRRAPVSARGRRLQPQARTLRIPAVLAHQV